MAGIDEAGFGPLLGPLVVSCTAFSVDPSLVEADLWQSFKRSVGPSRKHLAGRLLIADSKKAFDRSRGLGHLERTVLAVLRVLDKEPANLHELLDVVCPDCVGRLVDYPWYRDVRRQALPTDVADRRIAAHVLAGDMQTHGISLAALHSSCLDVAHYNTLVGNVRNKSNVLFIAAAGLIQKLLDAFPNDEVHVLIDRHGGRVHYRQHLMRSFPEMELKIVEEGPEASTYDLHGGARTVRLHFEIHADDRHLPVALASMVSKYLRELLMDCINRYFSTLDSGLEPTAGYWKDGLRFLEEVRTRLPDLDIDPHRLVRCR